MAAIYGEGTMTDNGFSSNIWQFGIMVYTCDLITITWKAAIVVDYWVKFTFIAIFGSIAFWFFFFPVYAVIAPAAGISKELLGLQSLFASPAFWFGIILIPLLANLRDYTWKV